MCASAPVCVCISCVCLHWSVRRNDGMCNQGQMDYNFIQTDKPITKCVACERHVCVTRCLLRTFGCVTPLQICASPRPHSHIFPAFSVRGSCFVYDFFFFFFFFFLSRGSWSMSHFLPHICYINTALRRVWHKSHTNCNKNDFISAWIQIYFPFIVPIYNTHFINQYCNSNACLLTLL